MNSLHYLAMMPKYAASILAMGLTIRLFYDFIQGFFEPKRFLVGAGIILSLFLGWYLCQMAFGALQTAQATRDIDHLVCKPVMTYFDCNGWPIFSESLAVFTRLIYSAIHPLINVPLIVAQTVGAFYLYSRLARGILKDAPIEFLGSFFAGAFVFVSLGALPEVSSMMLKIIASLFSIKDTGGGSKDSLAEAHSVLAEWYGFLQNWDIANEERKWWDPTKYLGFTMSGFATIIINAPLFFLSIISIIYLLFQQLAIASIPLAVFMNAMQMKNDPLIVFKLSYRVGLYGVAQHLMWWFLSWLPKPPQFASEMMIEHTGVFNLILGGPALGVMTILILCSLVFGFFLLPFLVFQTWSDIMTLKRIE